MLVASRGVSWDRAGKARVLSILGRVGVVLGATVGVLSWTSLHTVSLTAFFGGFASLLLGFGMSLDAPREQPGELHLDEQGNLQVSIGKRRPRIVPRHRMRGAWVVRRLVSMREFHWVEIALRSGTTVAARVENEQQGRALVEALGFGTPGRVVAIPLAKRTRRLIHLVFAAAVYLIVILAGAFEGTGALFLLFPLLYELLRFLFRPPVLEIGNDSLRVGIGVRSLRVLKEQIARIVFFAPASLIVEKKDGKKLRILPLALDPARVAAAAALVDARLGDRAAPARANAFERGGRSLDEWRAGMRTVLDPSYRSSGATIDDAALVLTSPTSSVEQRIGAALALRIAGEPLERVRIAAEGTVDPKVRVVLDAIAEGADDERVDETLRAMAR